jgi:small subunit ribosomal protein S12
LKLCGVTFGCQPKSRRSESHRGSYFICLLRPNLFFYYTNRPQCKGTVTKAFTTKPKKPNPANRKVRRVKLSTGLVVGAYIPGIGHTSDTHPIALPRGGRTPDSPGHKHKVIRGKYDRKGVETRHSSRSKYGKKLSET